MADISKIKVGSTTYDIKDATARSNIATQSSQIGELISGKADKSNTFTKAETKNEINNRIPDFNVKTAFNVNAYSYTMQNAPSASHIFQAFLYSGNSSLAALIYIDGTNRKISYILNPGEKIISVSVNSNVIDFTFNSVLWGTTTFLCTEI